MNRQAENLREAFLYAVFESGSNVVNCRNRKISVHGAVAGDQNLVIGAAHVDFVAVREFMIFRLQ